MTVVILVLRLLAEAGALSAPLLVSLSRRRATQPEAVMIHSTDGPIQSTSRAPLISNLLAILAFFCCLWGPFELPGLSESANISLAALGLAVVIAGMVIMLRARAALGDSWSFAPKASHGTGLATSGLYGHVRHPIYLGMALLFFGTAVAFANWLSILFALLLIVPTLVWRALVEERLLVHVFGDQYVAYRRQTKMFVPYLL
ncbi:MAG TPA: isoprenylcysteine carboxylmethyltransferase family protein [Pirellulales bacterium]|nr:isoprenylcysteine carboxylmethyltransferase family protein [Pirellulales bacterium]